MNHLPKMLLVELENADWRLENGARHNKLYIGNRLVGVLSKGKQSETDRRAMLNLRTQIRRALRNKMSG